jgi:hypothetical protein
MPRVIVITDQTRPPDDGSVLLDERVESVHLSTGHAAAQLVERLAWAISDAEDAEGVPASRRVRTRGQRVPRGRLVQHGPRPTARVA